jgi:DNA-directed RNA polymerase subunit RPC12/RpoP
VTYWLQFKCPTCHKRLRVQQGVDLKVCPYCETGQLVREYTPEEVRVMRDEAMVDAYEDHRAEEEYERHRYEEALDS